MKFIYLLAVLPATFTGALARPGNLHDANDMCAAMCQADKGAPKDTLNKQSGKCVTTSNIGVQGSFCANNCDCSRDGKMTCTNPSKGSFFTAGTNKKCSNDDITKICKAGMDKNWACWCQDLSFFSDGTGPGVGETCGKH